MLGSCSCVHVGSGKILCAVSVEKVWLCWQLWTLVTGCAAPGTGNWRGCWSCPGSDREFSTDRDWRPLELQPSTWGWISTDLMLDFCWQYAQLRTLSFFPRSIHQYWFKMSHFYQYSCQKTNLVKYSLKANMERGLAQGWSKLVKDSNKY